MPFADLSLARRIEAAQAWGRMDHAQIHARLFPDSGSAVEPLAGGYAVFRSGGFPKSVAQGMGLQGTVVETEVEQMEDFYRGRGAPATVDLCPFADLSLVEVLGRRGYRLAEWNNILARPLQPGEPAAPLSGTLRVRQVHRDETELWTQIVSAGFFGKEATRPGLENGECLAQSPTSQCFLALIDGEPAGGAAVLWHEGVATLLAASTLSRFRKQGVQTALMQARLAIAAAKGCDLATVNTEPGSDSQRNAERQGFHVVYTRALLIRAWA